VVVYLLLYKQLVVCTYVELRYMLSFFSVQSGVLMCIYAAC